MATRIVLIDSQNTILVNLGIQPVALEAVGGSCNSCGNKYDGLVGASFTNSKAVNIVGLVGSLGGIQEVFLAFPQDGECTVARSLAGQSQSGSNKAVTIGKQLSGSSVAGNVEQSVLTVDVGVGVDHGRSGG